MFDQYKNKIDENAELFKLNDKLKKINKFCIIACCTLNDKDIRYYKLKNLFGNIQLKNQSDNIEIIEIKDILDNNILSIDNNGPFDDAFSKLGKNIKNYIELSQIKNSQRMIKATKIIIILEIKNIQKV